MRFFNVETGELHAGADGETRLYAHMPAEALLRARDALGGAPTDGPPPEKDDAVPFPAFEVPGGRLCLICFLSGGKLHAVECRAAAVGRHRRRTAERQRAFLFECLGASDPRRDTRRPVLLRCPFGTASVGTDPRDGEALLRITYR